MFCQGRERGGWARERGMGKRELKGVCVHVWGSGDMREIK